MEVETTFFLLILLGIVTYTSFVVIDIRKMLEIKAAYDSRNAK